MIYQTEPSCTFPEMTHPPGSWSSSSTRDHQAGNIVADLVGDLAVAHDDLADGVDAAAGHGHAHGPVSIGNPHRKPAEGVGEGFAPLRGILSIRDRHAHAFFGFARVSGLNPAEEDVPEFGPDVSRSGQHGPLRVYPLVTRAGSRLIGGRLKFLTRCEGRGGGRARSGRRLELRGGIRHGVQVGDALPLCGRLGRGQCGRS